MDYHQIVQTVARELDMPEELVDKTYKAFWLNIKSRIIDLPLKEDLDE